MFEYLTCHVYGWVHFVVSRPVLSLPLSPAIPHAVHLIGRDREVAVIARLEHRWCPGLCVRVIVSSERATSLLFFRVTCFAYNCVGDDGRLHMIFYAFLTVPRIRTKEQAFDRVGAWAVPVLLCVVVGKG